MVADDASKSPSPFDVRTIKYLVGLMSQHDLSEIDLREGDLRIRLRRGAREIVVAPPPAALPAGPPPSPPPPPSAAGGAAPGPIPPINEPTTRPLFRAPT